MIAPPIPTAIGMETYYGLIRTPQDAIILFEACRLGRLRRVHRRLTDSERAVIRPGSVFVWNEVEAGMRRWTDGKSWSASRVSGSFLHYREMDGRRAGSAPAPAAAPSNPTTTTTTTSIGNKSSESPTTTTQPHLDDPAEAAYKYKPAGLVKQSFSITTRQGVRLHLISYFHRNDPATTNADPMPVPSEDPRLSDIVPFPDMYPDSSISTPVALHQPALLVPAYDRPRYAPPPQGYAGQAHYHHPSDASSPHVHFNHPFAPRKSVYSVSSLPGHLGADSGQNPSSFPSPNSGRFTARPSLAHSAPSAVGPDRDDTSQPAGLLPPYGAFAQAAQRYSVATVDPTAHLGASVRSRSRSYAAPNPYGHGNGHAVHHLPQPQYVPGRPRTPIGRGRSQSLRPRLAGVDSCSPRNRRGRTPPARANGTWNVNFSLAAGEETPPVPPVPAAAAAAATRMMLPPLRGGSMVQMPRLSRSQGADEERLDQSQPSSDPAGGVPMSAAAAPAEMPATTRQEELQHERQEQQNGSDEDHSPRRRRTQPLPPLSALQMHIKRSPPSLVTGARAPSSAPIWTTPTPMWSPSNRTGPISSISHGGK